MSQTVKENGGDKGESYGQIFFLNGTLLEILKKSNAKRSSLFYLEDN